MTKKQITSYVLLAFWMIVIFILSNQPSDISSKNSIGAINDVLSVFGVSANKDLMDVLNEVGRSFMHGFVFFVLGILSYRSFLISKFKKPFLLAINLSFGYALLDEIHQLFVPGRAFQGSDLLIDFIGAFLGIYLLSKITSKKGNLL